MIEFIVWTLLIYGGITYGVTTTPTTEDTHGAPSGIARVVGTLPDGG